MNIRISINLSLLGLLRRHHNKLHKHFFNGKKTQIPKRKYFHIKGPTKSRPEPTGRRPEPSGGLPGTVRTLSGSVVAMRCYVSQFIVV